MQTQTTCSLPPQDSGAREEREIFSHQTLILTALTAINSPNHHPILHATQVNEERLQLMRDKTLQTSTIDAATTILVTDTEILASMARGVYASDSIFALRELQIGEPFEDEARVESQLRDLDPNTSSQILEELDELLPDTLNAMKNGDEGRVSDKDVFFSIPNPNKAISIESSTSSDPICKPIAMGGELWTRIMESKTGFMFNLTK
jgi:hypothetical protein